jgi:L-cysteine:1D-myo-inositol 2-amino-2-deoxy-alpha-D-glucopyranoside ligase
VRERLADDLNAPGALGVVDAWADEVLSAGGGGAGGGGGGEAAGAGASVTSTAAELVRDTVNALLGVLL